MHQYKSVSNAETDTASPFPPLPNEVIEVPEFTKYRLYNAESVLSHVPDNAGGVYKIAVAQNNSDNVKVRYVGQAQNLRERLSQHLLASEPNECLREYVSKYELWYCWMPLRTANERADKESELIAHFDPKCNFQHP